MFMIELLGTVAFAISGSMIAIERKMDLFGVVFLGVTTAVGGGMLRDLFLGVHPPMLFENTIYVWVATGTSLLMFIYAYFHKRFHQYMERMDALLNVSDAIGLGAFVVVGVDMALKSQCHDRIFLCVFVGFITGVGGGILRDVLAGQIPTVFYKRVYAVVALLGAYLYVILRLNFEVAFAGPLTILVIMSVRLEARRHHWQLPRIKEKSDEIRKN